jgi:malate dehydrogenase
MPEVAILGAGELGGELAQALAARDVVRVVRLVDDAPRVAAGKALDIAQAAAILRFSTKLTGATDVTAAAGADVIVLADRVVGGEWRGEEGVLLLKRLARLAPDSIILCAGAAQRDLVEQGVRALGFARQRLFGSAPEALAGALRGLVALEVDGSPRDVALTVLGVPPAHTVVPWEDATIGGIAAMRILDGPARRRLAARVAPLWPPGPRALSAAATNVIAATLEGSRQALALFVGPDDSQGRRTRAAALPARLGPGGIEPVDRPALSVHDQVALENAILL